MRIGVALALIAVPLAAQTTWSDWSGWAPRPEIAPRTFIDKTHPAPRLGVSGDSNAAEYGGWEQIRRDIRGGAWYNFQASYQAEGIDFPVQQVVVRLDWINTSGKRTGQPDYPWRTRSDGEVSRVAARVQAPPEAAGVKIQLLLLNAPRATVWWNDAALEPAQDPGPRQVRVASVNLRPHNTADPVAEFLKTLEKSLPAKTDIALLPEGVTVVGTGKSYVEVAESIPGPTTERLGAFAKAHGVWIAAGIFERERQAVYNTAVLIDREGRVAGRYRKVYIPREELEGGITPGSDYPVFHTDFGTVGMMICWDVQYTDPARALALAGAEVILMPIWGGNETLTKARAIENQVFLASSGYDHPTYIVDPNGEVLSRASEPGTVAMATIDLNRRYLDPWLGDMRARLRKELRADVKSNSAGGQ